MIRHARHGLSEGSRPGADDDAGHLPLRDELLELGQRSDSTMLLNDFHSVAGQTSECERPSVRMIAEILKAVSMSGAENTSR